MKGALLISILRWFIRSITRKIALVLLVAITLVLSVSGMLLFTKTKSILLQNTEAALTTINSATTQQIGVMLQDHVTLAHRMASDRKVVDFLSEVNARDDIQSNAAYPQLIAYLEQIHQSSNSISVAWIASEAGSYFILDNRTISSPEYIINNRPWHKKAMDSVGVFFTDPYIDLVTSKMAIDVMEKVVVDNKTIGYAAITIFVDHLPVIMNQYRVGQHGYTFLLDQDGTILFHPDRNLVMKGWSDQVPQQTNIKDLSEGMAMIELNGHKQYTIITRLPLTEWYVASAIPESEVLDRLNSLYLVSLLFNLGSGIVLVLLVSLLLKYMLKKIPVIINQLRLIAEGQMTDVQAFNSQDELGRISAAIRDMSNKIHASMQLIHEAAYYDALTGLPNRRFLDEKLAQAVEDAKQSNEKMALIFIDLDNFKWINDTRGHKFGDELLRQVGSQLLENHDESTMVFRFGGDEFVILMEHVRFEQEVRQYAEQLRKALSAPFDLFHQNYYVNFSAGVVLFPDDGLSEEELLKNSDTAMYRAKSLGKNTIQYFSSDMIGSYEEKEKLTQALRHAVHEQALTLQYQAIVDARSNRLYGFEALLRWAHPEFGPISPAQFIPLAEQIGLIVPIGEWVLKEACRACRTLQDEYPVTISVNVSVLQLLYPNFIETVCHALHESGLEPHLLVLEITEGTVIENFEQSVEALRQLRALGVRIALDDFGTGYSSLSYLKNLPIDILKLDKMFIWDLDIDSLHSNKIVGPIIDLAHNLGLNIVSEGVETRDQAEMLRTWGCDMLQGYWYSKPISFHEIEDLHKRLTEMACVID